MQTEEARADIREMYVVHNVFRREYHLLPDLVLDVAADDLERAELIAEHITFLNSLLDRHHTGEDSHLWPKLLIRAADSLAPLIHTIEDQHKGVHEAMSELDEVLRGWRSNPDPRNRAAVVDAIGVLSTRLEEHLQLEEQQILPLIEDHISAAEWTEMTQEGGADTPPEQGPVIFGMLMYEGDPAVLNDMFANMPPEVAAVLPDIAPPAYQEYCRKIHGTPTPH